MYDKVRPPRTATTVSDAQGELNFFDIGVTVLVFLVGGYDLIWSVVNAVDPSSPLGSLAGYIPICHANRSSADDSVIGMVRIASIGSVEGGLGTCLISLYRLTQYLKRERPNPFAIFVRLTLDLLGTVAVFFVLYYDGGNDPDSRRPDALRNTAIRAAISVLGLVFTFLAYRGHGNFILCRG